MEVGLELEESGLDLVEAGLELEESGLDLVEAGLEIEESGLDLLEAVGLWKTYHKPDLQKLQTADW